MTNEAAVTPPARMRALTLTNHGTLADVLLSDMPVPTAGDGEVLVQLKAAALNRLDLWVIGGWPGLSLDLPHILGSDGAGIVAAIGGGVTRFRPGDRVALNPTLSCGKCAACLAGRDNLCQEFSILGEHTGGTYAAFIAVPERNLLALPAHVSFEEAAAAGLVYVTAWHSLITRGGLRAGESVLVVGAGGGVNTAAIQVARLAGASTIYVVGSTPEKLALARELGADALFDSRDDNWSKTVYQATGRRGVDVVVDNVGAATYAHSLRVLARGGRLLTVGNSSGPHVNLDNRLLFGKHLSIIGSTMGPIADFEEVMGLLFAGRLRAIIDAVYPLEEGLVALERLAAGDVAGKLVLTI